MKSKNYFHVHMVLGGHVQCEMIESDNCVIPPHKTNIFVSSLLRKEEDFEPCVPRAKLVEMPISCLVIAMITQDLS